MSAHSTVGASSMYRWSACPGSVRLSKGIKTSPSKYADEGTKAHDLAAKRLESGKWCGGIDVETKVHLQVYVDSVEAEKFDESFIEHKFDLSDLFPGMFGTADFVGYKRSEKKLSVWDLKYGAGIPVEATDSKQLQFYALGALMTLNLPCNEVEVVIAQPRCHHNEGPIRRWAFNAVDLLDFAADALEAARKTEDPNAPLSSGDHCRFCPAAAFCPELNKKAVSVAKQEFSDSVPYDASKLSEVLAWLPVLNDWSKSVREFAYNEIQKGRKIPGWKLVSKRATRKWKMDDEETASALECMLPDQECYWERKLKSPAQVEKLLGKDGAKELEELTIKESSGATLVEESDKRPAVKPDALAEFSAICDGE
jgi:hypothetical protein